MPTPTVLVTGATGFLGGAVAAELLFEHPACRLLLLVRARRGKTAELRVRDSLTRFLGPVQLERLLPRCTVIAGDLTEPASLADPRLHAATHVLHLAANTSFRSHPHIQRVNVDATLALAHRMREVRNLVRFAYVGTAYICGPSTPPVVREDDSPRPNTRHLSEYAASKAECEMLLEPLARELPLVVVRPSVVVGHTRLGCFPSASIFWYYRVLNRLRCLPAPLETQRDIVPVDYVAKALLKLIFKPVLRHTRYHISAGEAGSASWSEIMAAFDAHLPDASVEPYRVVDFPTLASERASFQRVLGPGDESLLLHAAEGYFRFGSGGVGVFDNARLLDEGVPAPPRFTDYLGTCLNLSHDRSVYEQMLDDF